MTILNPSLIPSDIDELYKFCNKRYFNNELPKNIDLEWSPKMFKKLGLAISRSNILDDNHTIRLSETIRGNKLKSLNIMVHEMLHISAYNAYEKTGKRFYLDLSTKNNKYNQEFNKGHGPVFHKWKNELNEQYQELNISTKDDENYDDFEVNEKNYYGIYVQFTTIGKEVYHTVYYSGTDFRDNEGTDLIDGLKALCGEENILAAKTFMTGNHDIKNFSQLTAKGILRKKSALGAYNPDFIEKIILHETTQFDAEMSISRNSEYDHISENLRKISNRSDKNKVLSFSKYSHSISTTYGREFNNPALSRMSVNEVISDSVSGLKLDELDYLYKKWHSMSEVQFLERAKTVVSSLCFAVKRNYTLEKIIKDLDYNFSNRGLHRFDENVLMSKLKEFCEKEAINKGYSLDFDIINQITLSFNAKSINECNVKALSSIDLTFEKFLQHSISVLRDNGHMNDTSTYIDEIKNNYENVSIKQISDTVAQCRFNLLMSEVSTLMTVEQEDELQSLLDRFEGRISESNVINAFVTEYQKEAIKNGEPKEKIRQTLLNLKCDVKESIGMTL